MPKNRLTPEEERVIVHKGTEAPFSGEYWNHFERGTYVCRRCDAPLYHSKDKFEAECGWPSFDREIPGAVTRTLDTDGLRTEIVCAACKGHMGHVFEGEHLTPRDTRHCVNSLSLKFIPADDGKKSLEIAVFGNGCFWSTEAIFSNLKGVESTVPGYAGGTAENPTYEQVCMDITGHAEVIKIVFDPSAISYEGLLEVFFHTHDPTSLNRQGNDHGTQYRSIILTTSEEQLTEANRMIDKLTTLRAFKAPIVTEVKPLDHFYEAESYHHNYFKNNPEQAYCQWVIAPKVGHFQERFGQWVKKESILI
ncbi:bifunctional methionine sulfoxide reductase B/A protein [Candidatus Peregrinibacteria bacterium]|nr:bifunctional methionine sulfoxide reductase B/A protein [Candidatus Peregrinibacteria bacterium]